MSASEREVLLKIHPETDFVPAAQGFEQIPCRPDGGACVFLAAERCTVRDVRPFPCRSFPVGVHIGGRVQAALVLACPGVSLAPLQGWPNGTRAGPRGLDEEMRSVTSEMARSPLPALLQEAERRRRGLARRTGMDPETMDGDLRRAVEDELRGLPFEDVASWEPPSAEVGIANLPLFFDPKHGRVALAASAGGWELLAVAEGGGVVERLGTFLPPVEAPSMDADARQLLVGYLRYVLARDHTIWSVYEENPDAATPDSLADRLLGRLNEVAGTVLRRASVRSREAGVPSDRLGLEQLESGIRATDLELLDRPTLGRVL